MKYLFVILFLILIFSQTNYSQVIEYRGFVKTSDGTPLKDVYIDKFGISDETGYYKIACDCLRYWKAVVFHKEGFVPKPVLLEDLKTNSDIVLEPETENKIWEIPNCPSTKSEKNRIVGVYLLLNVPKNLKYKSGIDTDYRYFLIGFKSKEKRALLRGGLGNYAGVYPSGETLLTLKSFTFRRTSVGIDWRGITKEGNYWRYFGAVSFMETYYYETNIKEAAETFDKILDGVCFQPKS
jgi:hypothetical protein